MKTPTTLTLLTTLTLTACTSTPPTTDNGYYGGDRPPQHLPIDPDSVPDAIPQHEPLSATGNNPYTALGKRYHPLPTAAGYVRRGTASWYGKKFHGRRTSSGEPYDMFAMTAAHPVLPLPSYVRVTNLDTGKSVVVKVNDRGPFLHDRIIDLSYLAAHKLGIAAHGTGRVEVRAIIPNDDGGGLGQSDQATTDTDSAGQGDQATDTPTTLLQVGAYAKHDNARHMRRLLELAGYRVTPLTTSHPPDRQTLLYHVRVGPFPHPQKAHATQQKLEALLGHSVTLITE